MKPACTSHFAVDEAVFAVLDGPFTSGPFPAVALVDALQLTREFASCSAPGLGSEAQMQALLAALHLDFAAVEAAEAFDVDLTPGQAAGHVGVRDARAHGQCLLERCALALNRVLDPAAGSLSKPPLSPAQLLACTRAVLQLDAARRAWPRDVAHGSHP